MQTWNYFLKIKFGPLDMSCMIMVKRVAIMEDVVTHGIYNMDVWTPYS
jgi:hypothetical protein